MAVATDAMICTINLMVSFFVMVSLGYKVDYLVNGIGEGWGAEAPLPLVSS